MSKMTTGNITIYEAINNIKTRKYVMPAFQRQYVWSMEQIEKLWDSILSDYPIATFLFWNINEDNINWDTYFCQFLEKSYFNSRKMADTSSYELNRINLQITDTAILDGQQRLTSLFLSLCGEVLLRQKYARKKYGEGTIAKLYIELDEKKLLWMKRNIIVRIMI